MEVYVKGKLLDVQQGGELNISFQNIRFGGSVLPDAVTTDIDVPLTKHNRLLLGIAFEFYNGKPNRVNCECFTNGKRYVGYIVVNSTTEYTASITIYLSMSFTELANLPLRNLRLDDDYTIFRWYESQAGNGTNTFPQYAVEKQSTKGCYGRHPVADHIKIKAAIENVINATIDESDWQIPDGDEYWDLNDIAVVATGKYVTPANKSQCIVAVSLDGSTDFSMYGGQHIVNDLIADEQPFWNSVTSQFYPSIVKNSITFNRRCNATLIGEKYNDAQVRAAYINVHHKDGTDTGLIPFDNGDFTLGHISRDSQTYTFEAGDVMTIYRNENFGDQFVMLKIDYSNYSINENDYDTELMYQPVICEWSTFGVTAASPSHADWSFAYIGLWNNMPEKSVKSYLTTICWMSNMRYIRTNNPASLKMVALGTGGSILEREQVESIIFASDRIGKTNIIRYTDEALPSAVIYADGEGLEEEKVLFESEFKTPRSPRDLTMSKRVCVPIYSVDFEEEGVDSENWKVNYEDLEGVIAMICHDEDYIWAYLTMPPLLKKMNLDDFSTIVEIEGWTRQPIVDDDSFVIDGERFAVISVDYDDSENSYHYRAIRITARSQQI